LRCAAFAGTLCGASVALAQTPADETAVVHDRSAVKGLMRNGLAELRLGHVEAARKAFAKAWEFDQQPTIALSLAEVEMQLGLYLEAAEHWLFFLKEADPDNPERPNAHNQLAECRQHLGKARIVVNVDDADILVDDRFVGRAPLSEET